MLANAGCQVNAIPDEWLSMKLQINTSFRDKDYGSLWQTLLTKMPYRQDFQNVLHLVEILLVLPISAAQCERAISAQNRIKSSMRVKGTMSPQVHAQVDNNNFEIVSLTFSNAVREFGRLLCRIGCKCKGISTDFEKLSIFYRK